MILAFIFGLIFGSFLNVVIYRLKTPQWRGGTAENIISGRSFCPDCMTQLKWRDLVPVLSFVWLRGHCRYCRKKISWQYPIVEVFSGLVWIGVFYKIFGFQPLLDFVYYIFILSSLLIIAVYDFKWKIIPDKIVYPAVAIVLIYNFFKSLNLEIFKFLNVLNIETFLSSLLVAVAAFFFFFSIYYFSKGRAMGLGDAKLAFLIGLFLSPLLAVVAFTLAFIIGAVFGIILIGLGQIFPRYRKWGMKSQIAFGPFLVLGALISFFFSDFIINFFLIFKY